ncbi:hypothetical protein RN001_009208 [Aquatica leii]|uniref:Kinesin-like protein n=1 Tax=Aquatica leii TaxID=1421715 RepID=A0AAN7P4W9_9COLE|nr:hypothetical protein RN001_009208 [Aquatica leii]
MSYGASSSGKTFTIVGTSEEPGIIPRSLEYLFRTLPTLPEVPLIKPNASGGISYMTEADWLKDKMDRQILLSKHTNMDYALHKQTYNHSSRSHCVFTLKIAQASTTNKEEFVSVFNFCDLAGSERIKKTQNVGDRLKESNSINKSLLVLGRCIKLIRDKQKLKTRNVIPFRDSKLTQLFQKALLGHESVWMIININTSREMFDETQHVLQFSAIAKDVIVEQQILKACSTKRVSELLDTQIDIATYGDKLNVKELQEQFAFLSDQLKQQRLDNEEDREHVIRSYKAILEDTNKYWEKKSTNYNAISVHNPPLPPREHLAVLDAMGSVRTQLQQTEQADAALCRVIESSGGKCFTDPNLLLLKATSAASLHCLFQCLHILQRNQHQQARTGFVTDDD